MAVCVADQVLRTTGEICAYLNEPHHSIRYVIESRGIAPDARCGRIGLYSPASVARIADVLAAKEARAARASAS
jgi:hypothetical protein